MTNREKYAEQILDIACNGNALALNRKTMKPICCTDTNCAECYFSSQGDHCEEICREWSNTEYVNFDGYCEDWTKVPVDTPILVKDRESDEWFRRYFAKYENEQVYAWCDGCTSWSKLYGDEDCSPWNYAKLAEESEQ